MSDRSPEALLADTKWLNRLTRGLVRDPDLAEDVRQETLAAALRSPHGTERNWLARVARNLATSMLRRETRRQKHESAASHVSPAPTPPDQLLAEAELQQAAVTALMELDEPYRRTLLLRYMKGLSVRAVAKAMNVPGETVRTRIKRGIVQLRTRLDRRPGGRLALCLPMTVAGWPSPTTTALWGLVIMKTKSVVGFALVAVIASLFGIYSYAGGGDSSPDDPVAIAPLVGSGDADPKVKTAGEEREVVAGGQSVNLDPVVATATGSLLVKVVWTDNGEPARNVCVRVRKWHGFGNHAVPHGEWVPESTITDEAGLARFDDLPAGPQRVSLDRKHAEKKVEIEAGRETEASFRLEPRMSARGIVVDLHGQAVSGAQILTGYEAIFPLVNVVGTSDKDGRFALRGLWKYNYVGARGAGHSVSDFILMLNPKPSADGVVDLRLVLPGGSSRLRGCVLDKNGDPVTEAWVKIGSNFKRRKGGWIAPPIVNARTDQKGRFEVADLREGSCRVRVFARGHAPLDTEVQVDPFHIEDVELRLLEGATLIGRVLDTSGRPVAGIWVSIDGTEIPQPNGVKTDADGKFRVADLGTGSLRLQLRGEPRGELDQTVEMIAGQVLDRDFELKKGMTIRGKLVDARGAPLVGWKILSLVRGTGMLKSAKTDSRGEFAIANCTDRPHKLEIRREPLLGEGIRKGTIKVLLDVRPGPTRKTYTILDEWMPSAVVRGRVFDSDGKPMPDVVISIKLADATFWTRAPTTDAEGRFETGELPPGDYELTIGHIRHVAVSQKFTLTPNQKYEIEKVVMQARPKKK